MKKITLLIFTMILLVSADVELLDVDYKSREKFLNEDYVLNGAGIRDKFIFDIYTIGLYVKEKSTSSSVILNSDANKYVRIVIVSRLVTAERFSDGLDEGFEKSTGGNIDPIKDEIELVRKGFGSDFEKGDEFIVFLGKTGETTIYKKGRKPYVIPSKNKVFQKALLGMWIGEDPILDDLKDELLGTD
tara:strand:- start:1619 stop:2182 length:564 start_codon:yes stop_codon:yes gene_type:complete